MSWLGSFPFWKERYSEFKRLRDVADTKMLNSDPPQKSIYQTVRRNAFYRDAVTGIGPSPRDSHAYHIPHHPEAARQLLHGDVLKKASSETILWGKELPYPGNSMHINSETFFFFFFYLVSPVGRTHGFEDQGVEQEWPQLIALIVIHWLTLPSPHLQV